MSTKQFKKESFNQPTNSNAGVLFNVYQKPDTFIPSPNTG